MKDEDETITVTLENQQQAEREMPRFLALPARHKVVCVAPMRGPVDLSRYAAGGIERVVCAGDPAADGCILDFRWVRELRTGCVRAAVPFFFQSTGARFRMDGHLYRIAPDLEESQAGRSGMSYIPGHNDGAKIRYTLPERDALFSALEKSRFRSSFHLGPKERAYLEEKGMEVIREHARDFVRMRLAPENPPKDGRQTPMRGHPVFQAQHATACCCRSCLEKWHHIPSGKVLTEEEQDYIVDILMTWIQKEALR
jgi:hypothetical protein